MEGKPIWVWAAAAVLALLMGTHLVRGAGLPGMPDAPADAIRISIATSSTKQEWMHQGIQAFNAASPTDRSLQVEGRPVVVDLVQEVVDGRKVDYRSGTMVSDTLDGK